MKFKVAALALLATTSIATAADMGTAAPYSKAPMARVFDWTGFYIGAGGGYGWTNTSNLDMKGGFVGGQLGYSAQFGSWVLGIEADGHWANIEQTVGVVGLATAQSKIDAYGTVRGRVGYAFDQVLLYGTGGVAFADNKITATLLGLSASDSQVHIGWTAGAGVEFALNRNWSAKVEYLYADFGSKAYFNNLITTGNIQVSTVKGGINYRF